MKTFKELKKSAINNLSGNWLKTIIGVIIATCIVNGVSFSLRLYNFVTLVDLYFFDNRGLYYTLSAIAFFISLLFNGPISYGYANYFLKLARKEETVIADFFKGIQKFALCFKTFFIVSLLFSLWTLLMYLLYFLPLNLFLYFLSGKIGFAIIIVKFVLKIIFYIIFFIHLTYIYARYFLVFYLMVDSEKTKAINYIKESKVMMSGHAKKFLSLVLSFFGWSLLIFIVIVLVRPINFYGSIFILLVGALLLFIYIKATFTEFYLDILEQTKNYTGFKYVKLLEDNNYIDHSYL